MSYTVDLSKSYTFTGTNWDLFHVNLEKRTAFVWNGRWELHWDDTDFYGREPDGFLHWICERNENELIEVKGDQP